MIAIAWLQGEAPAAPAGELPAGLLHAGAMWSVVVPAALLVFTAFATWLLYRKFERQESTGTERRPEA